MNETETDQTLEAAYRLLGLARRSGQLSFGSQAAEQAVKRGKAFLIWIAEDTGPNTSEKIQRLARQAGLPLIRRGGRAELGRRCGKEEAVVMAVTEKNLARGILAQLKPDVTGEQNELSG